MKYLSCIFYSIFLCSTLILTSQNNRNALVIGVKSYEHIDPLRNTLNDAMAMSKSLKESGFNVIEVYEPDSKRVLQDAVIEYFKILRRDKEAIGLIYYSGHGMQVDGSNYLIPKGANPQIKADLEDQCLNMDYVMRAISEAGNHLNIFILDACRNNPFKGFYRSDEQGLKMMNTPKGSYIVYATKPGSVASDGNGENGLFTSQLLRHMNTSGLSLEQVFKKVAQDVSIESNDTQRPWIASDYIGDFYFQPPNPSSIVKNENLIAQQNTTDQTPDQPSLSENTSLKNQQDFDFGYSPGISKVISISDQTWNSHNLNLSTFRNGDKIPKAYSLKDWNLAMKAQSAAYCYVDFDDANEARYGKVYNWYAVTDLRGICPKGWHVPTVEEWNELTKKLGFNAGIRLQSTLWDDKTNREDEFGFAATPNGILNGKWFLEVDNEAYWWTASPSSKDGIWAAGTKKQGLETISVDNDNGLCIRCIKDQ